MISKDIASWLDTVTAVSPRSSASDGEKSLADHLAARLRKMGLLCYLQEFSSATSFVGPLLLPFLLGGVSSLLLAQGLPGWALLAGLPALLLYRAEAKGLHLFPPFPCAPSRNLVARIPPIGTRIRDVVLLAHLDTARSSWLTSPLLGPGFRLSAVITSRAHQFLGLASLAGLLFSFLLPFLSWPALACAAWHGWVLLLLGQLYFFGRPVPGASDNSSGVATVLAAVEELARAPLGQTRVTVLLTGSEESGLWGIRHFLEKEGEEYVDALFLNVDNVGSGALRFSSAEGILSPVPILPEIKAFLESLPAGPPGEEIPVAPYTWCLTDASPLIFLGWRAVSLLALDQRGIPRHWHRQSDAPENLAPANLERATAALVAAARQWDAVP